MNTEQQLKQARWNTLLFLREVDESLLHYIGGKTRNHILWHAGHLYVTCEKFVFQNEQLPDGFLTSFAKGTSPLNGQSTPSIEDVTKALEEQMNRIEHAGERAVEPIETATGFSLRDQQSQLVYALYHEGMHFGIMKQIQLHG